MTEEFRFWTWQNLIEYAKQHINKIEAKSSNKKDIEHDYESLDFALW